MRALSLIWVLGIAAVCGATRKPLEDRSRHGFATAGGLVRQKGLAIAGNTSVAASGLDSRPAPLPASKAVAVRDPLKGTKADPDTDTSSPDVPKPRSKRWIWTVWRVYQVARRLRTVYRVGSAIANAMDDDDTPGGSSSSGGSCSSTEGSARDNGGDSCSWYDSESSSCGNHDDADFNAGTMCCACNGGSRSSSSDTSGQVTRCTDTIDDGLCRCSGAQVDVEWYEDSSCSGECGYGDANSWEGCISELTTLDLVFSTDSPSCDDLEAVLASQSGASGSGNIVGAEGRCGECIQLNGGGSMRFDDCKAGATTVTSAAVLVAAFTLFLVAL